MSKLDLEKIIASSILTISLNSGCEVHQPQPKEVTEETRETEKIEEKAKVEEETKKRIKTKSGIIIEAKDLVRGPTHYLIDASESNITLPEKEKAVRFFYDTIEVKFWEVYDFQLHYPKEGRLKLKSGKTLGGKIRELEDAFIIKSKSPSVIYVDNVAVFYDDHEPLYYITDAMSGEINFLVTKDGETVWKQDYDWKGEILNKDCPVDMLGRPVVPKLEKAWRRVPKEEVAEIETEKENEFKLDFIMLPSRLVVGGIVRDLSTKGIIIDGKKYGGLIGKTESYENQNLGYIRIPVDHVEEFSDK